MKYLIFVCFVLILNTGCATLFTGTHDKVYFHTEPEGAKVMINGVSEGTTSNEIKVRRTLGKREVTLQKEGYEPRIIRMEKSFNLVTIGNLFGVVGFAVDIATGAVVKYDKVYYDVELEKIE
jgi:hypothetical protein